MMGAHEFKKLYCSFVVFCNRILSLTITARIISVAQKVNSFIFPVSLVPHEDEDLTRAGHPAVDNVQELQTRFIMANLCNLFMGSDNYKKVNN